MRSTSDLSWLEEYAERFWARVDKSGECWNWTNAANSRGYGHICLGHSEVFLAHRFSWLLHYGAIHEGLLVCHHCDNRRCVRPDHLFLGTHKDNTADMCRKGRHRSNPPKGSRQVNSKLVERDVQWMRRRYAAGGVTLQALADEFGVEKSTVGRMIQRHTWKHAGEE